MSRGRIFTAMRCVAGALLVSATCFGGVSQIDNSQTNYERSTQSVVRQKLFYKTGHVEFGVVGGLMPYDLIINHMMVGGRATWHINDHFGWEIVDGFLTFPTVTSYLPALVSAQQISNAQAVKLRYLVTTSLLISPFYGKIRFFGRSVVHLDLYTVFGIGVAGSETLKFSAPTEGAAVTQATLRTGTDPVLSFGLGFRFFLNSALGLTLDIRDYLVSSPAYGTTLFRSNFAVFVGLSFFLPTF